jgi:nicotinamide phosphoribosyltransferase
MGHLLSFTGTDTIPAIYTLESSYKATGLIGASVPATEHSVMCMGTKESEIDTFKRLLNLYPTGILSVVSDTWDLWKVCTEYLSQLKSEILSRDGKLVIRPDSGDPVDIICGDAWRVQGFTEGVLNKVGENGIVLNYTNNRYYKVKLNNNYEVIGEETTDVTPANKGVIELLWDIFGGTINEQGYKVLDPHIGAIYGDSITLERAAEICERLKAKGFASTNIVLGIGSFTYQYNTRDTFGFAMKATYGEVEITEYTSPEQTEPSQWTEPREIFKDPITDDGTKKSKKGLLQVMKLVDLAKLHESKTIQDAINDNNIGDIICIDQCTWEEEKTGLLTTVFKDGKLVKETTLNEIRKRLNTL